MKTLKALRIKIKIGESSGRNSMFVLDIYLNR